MFRTATAAAVLALLCAPAMAQSVTVGQYRGITQYTGLNDTTGLCTSLAGLKVGQITKSVATVGGLGATWTDTISNSNPSPTATYGVTWINCAFSGLPAASAFTATTIGTAPATETEYVATPTGSTTTNCYASNGTPYVLTSSNSTLSNGTVQTVTITLLPSNGTGLDSGFRVTSTNSQLSVGGTTLCYLSTDAVYSHT
jgi:hypothetical protein